jgi:single-strand DNA-binding protein
MLPSVSGEFGVVAEPEMRFSNDGKPWLKIRAVAKDRRWNSETRQYEDVPDSVMYIDITVGGKAAENLAASIDKGDQIIVSNGSLSMREWTNDAGVTQKAYSIRANEIGVSTRFKAAGSAGGAPTAAAPKQSEVVPW